MSRPAFSQNIIAVIWDYDKTLIPGNMQKPLFDTYGVVESDFWQEVNTAIQKYSDSGCSVSPELMYLNHIIDYVKMGKFDSLNNDKLFKLGKNIEFHPGLPSFLSDLKNSIEAERKYREYDIKLEYYVVSTGLRKIIEGSSIAAELAQIWGCEFLEETYEGVSTLTKVSYALDHTTKTRAIFEINKGVNFDKRIQVNARMSQNQRRIPISQMIYIGDGPSDVPVFSVINRYQGKTFAVYHPGQPSSYEQAHHLLMNEGRIQAIGPADFTQGSPAYLWLMKTVRDIADKIIENRKYALNKSIGAEPKHLP